MIQTVDRNVLIVTPKKALIDWVNYIFPESPIDYTELGVHDQSNVYLLPKTDSIEGDVSYLKARYLFFLEKELFEWCNDKSLWPNELSWQLFDKFLSYSIQTVVFDTVKGNIEKEIV